MLKAKAIGRVDGMKAYKKALNYVALTYPQSKEGKYAQDKYNQLDQKVAKAEFNDEAEADEFKLVFEITSDVNVNELKETTKNEIQEMGYGFNLTKDAYSNDLTFLVVHGLNSKLGGQGLAKKLVEKLEELIDFLLIASSHNYRVIQI